MLRAALAAILFGLAFPAAAQQLNWKYKARHQAWSMTGAPFADDAIELLELRAD